MQSGLLPESADMSKQHSNNMTSSLVFHCSKREMKFDSILTQIGDFGRYQRFLALLLWVAVSPFLAFVIYGNMLLLLAPDHWCRLPDFPDNVTREERKKLAIPLEEVQGRLQYSRCYRYDFNFTEFNGNISVKDLPKTKCGNGWEYDYSLIYPTLVSEWNWICDDSWKTYFAYSVFWGGTAVGVLVMGVVADMFGRVPVVVVGHTVCAVASCATNFATDFVWFLIMRFIIGFVVIAQSMTAFVLVMEYVGSKQRLAVSTGFLFAYPLFGCILPWVAYALRDWKTINLLLSVPLFLIPLLGKFIPESLRWMVAKERYEAARRLLKKMAGVNKRSLPNDFFDSISFPAAESPERKATVVDLIKRPNLRRLFFLTNLSWMCTSLCFTGGYIYAATVSDNPFLMITANSALDVVANAIADRLADKYGRRPTAVSSLVVAAMSYVSIAAVPRDSFAVRTTFLVAGRLSLTAGYNVNYLYAAEVYPTVVRTQALAVRQALGSVGNFISPQVVLLAKYAPYLPLLVFGTISALAASVMFCLPETLNVGLPETLDDGEMLSKLPKPFFSCCRRTSRKDVECAKRKTYMARM